MQDNEQSDTSKALVPVDSGSTVSTATGRKKFTLTKTRTMAVGSPATFKVQYEKELNDQQLAAVLHRSGPLLVIAGAGTGKTRTLTYRVARLVESGVDPRSILLLTFTRRSASEMLRRAAGLLHDSKAEEVEGGTFHSYANKQLRKFAQTIGFNQNFTILDMGDAQDAINLLRTQMGLSSTRRRFPKKTTLSTIFSLASNRLTSVEEVIKLDYPYFEEDTEDILKLAYRYAEYKRKANAMDYDDLLTNFVLLLEQSSEIRTRIAKGLNHIMVDEYQDVNRLQARIVELLGKQMPTPNVMVVGDDAQSIYRFRGAEIENIFEFPTLFPGAEIIALEENYRSTQPILTLTNRVIELASRRYEKHLYSRVESEELPQIVCAENEHQQSVYVVEKILEFREMGVSLSDIAVLFRSGYMSFDLEIELQRANIPFQKFGGMKFIETSHIKDVIAMLRVLNNPKDLVSWYRILLLHDGVGPKTAERIVDDIMEERISLKRFTSTVREAGRASSLEMAKYPSHVFDLFGQLSEVSRDDTPLEQRVDRLIDYYKPILRKKYDDYQKREKDLETFELITDRYRSIASLLSDLSLDPPTESMTDLGEQAKEEEILTLSTIHSAKGLEWNTVIITNCLDGRFPSTSSANDPDDLEEERRLMYVAATRAKEHLIITYPTNLYDRESGIVLSKPSRFIDGLVEQELAEGWVIQEE